MSTEYNDAEIERRKYSEIAGKWDALPTLLACGKANRFCPEPKQQACALCICSMALETKLLDSSKEILHHFIQQVSAHNISLSAVALAVLCLYTFYFTIYGLFLCPTRHLPGPFITRFTKIYWLKVFFGGSIGSDILALHRKYGIIPSARFANRSNFQVRSFV